MKFERLRELSGLTEDIYKNNSKEEYYSFLELPTDSNAEKLAGIVSAKPEDIKGAKRVVAMEDYITGDYIKKIINSRSFIENKIDDKMFRKAYDAEMRFEKVSRASNFYDTHKEYRYFGLPELSMIKGREEGKQKELEGGSLKPSPVIISDDTAQIKHAERIFSTVAKGLSYQYHLHNNHADRIKSIPSGKYSIYQNLGNTLYGAVFNYNKGLLEFITFIYADPKTYNPSSDNDYKINLNDKSVNFESLKI